MPDIAQLGISVDSTSAVAATANMNAMASAAASAAAAVQNLNTVGGGSGGGSGQATAQAMAAAYQQLQQQMASLTGATGAFATAQAAAAQQAAAFAASVGQSASASGAATTAHGNASRSVSALGNAHHAAGLNVSAFTQEIRALADELSGGRYQNAMGTAVRTLAQFISALPGGIAGNLPIIGALAGIAAAAAGVGLALSHAASDARDYAANVQVLGSNSELTSTQIKAMAQAIEPFGANTSRVLESAIVASTKFVNVSDTMRSTFVRLAQDVSAYTGEDITKAMDQLASGLAGGVAGVLKLNDSFHFIVNDGQAQHIAALAAANKQQELSDYSLQLMADHMRGVADTMAGPVAKAWRDIKEAANEFFDELARSPELASLLEGVATVLKAILDTIREIKGVIDSLPSMPDLAQSLGAGFLAQHGGTTVGNILAGSLGKMNQAAGATFNSLGSSLDGYTGAAGDPETARRQAIASGQAAGSVSLDLSPVPTPTAKPTPPGTSGGGNLDTQNATRNAIEMNVALEQRAKLLAAEVKGTNGSAAAQLAYRLEAEAAAKGVAGLTQTARDHVVALQAEIDAKRIDFQLSNQEASVKGFADTISAEANQRDVLRAKIEADITARERHMNAMETEREEALRVAEVINQQDQAAVDLTRSVQQQTKAALEMADAYSLGHRQVANQTAAIEAHDAWLKNAQVDEKALTQEILRRNAAQAVQGVAKTASGIEDQVAEQKGLAAAIVQGSAATMEYNRQQEVLRDTLEARMAVEAAVHKAAQTGTQEDIDKANELNNVLQQQIQRLDAATQARDLGKQTQEAAAYQKSQSDALLSAQDELATVGLIGEARAKTLATMQAERDIAEKFPGIAGQARDQIVKTSQELAVTKERASQVSDAIAQWRKPLEDAIGAIQDSFGSLFSNIITKGLNSFKDFSSSVKDIFVKMAGQVMQQFLFNQVMGIGGIGGGAGMFGAANAATGASGGGGLIGVGNALAGYGSNGTAPGGVESGPYVGEYGETGTYNGLDQSGISAAAVPGFSVGGFLGSSALGYGAGQLTAGIGGRSGGQIGAAGGAMMGAAIGSIFPVVGTAVGAIVGGLVGGLGGGFLGGHPSVGPGSAASVWLNSSGQNGLVADADNGGDPNQAAQAITSFANSIQQLVGASGGSISSAFGLHYGQNQKQGAGYELITGGGTKVELGASPDLLNVLKALISSGSVTGLSASAQTVIAHTGDQNQLQANLAFAQQYDDFIKKWKDGPLSTLQQQLKDLGDSFTAARDKAAELGLSTQELTAAYNTELQRQRDAYNKDVSQQIDAILDPQKYALEVLQDQHDQAIKDATAIGGDINKVEQLYALKRQQILEQAAGTMTDAFGNALSKIKDMTASLQQELNQITMGPLSALSPQEQYAQATKQFQNLQSSIAANPGYVPSNINDITNQFLAASRAVNASSANYVSDYNTATNLLQKLLGQAPTNAANENISAQQLAALQQGNSINSSTLQVMQDMRDQIATLSARLTAMSTQQAGSRGL